MDIRFGHVCDRGLNPKRPVNQDRYLVDPDHYVFAVFDGVGGQRAGEVASQTAAETVAESLALDGKNTRPVDEAKTASHGPAVAHQDGVNADRIRTAIQFANRDIYELAAMEPAYDTMATTVALVQIADRQATVAHVGDSRVYRYEAGRLHRETIDHTDFDDRMRAGLEQPGGAVNDSHVINRALGAGPDVDVEINEIRFFEGARFLVCTDGIYRMVSDDEISLILESNETPQNAADELKRIAHERGADDNLTAVVVYTGSMNLNRGDGLELGTRARFADGTARNTTEIGDQITQPLAGSEASAQKSSSATPETRSTMSGLAARPSKTPDRISVELDRGPSKEFQSKQINPSEIREIGSVEARAGNPPALWILLLIGLVLLTGGFYLGLRIADWRRAQAEAREAGTATGMIKAARRAFEARDYVTAENTLSKIVKEQPASTDANYWLGRTELAEGNVPESIRHLDAALNLDPGLLDAYLQEAGAYETIGEKSKAAEMLARYLEARRKSQPPGK